MFGTFEQKLIKCRVFKDLMRRLGYTAEFGQVYGVLVSKDSIDSLQERVKRLEKRQAEGNINAHKVLDKLGLKIIKTEFQEPQIMIVKKKKEKGK